MDKKPFFSKTFFQAFFGAAGAFSFLAAAFLSGYYFHASQEKLPHFAILEEAYQILIHHSYQEAPEAKMLEYAMIHGLASAYQDPYTFFQEPVQHELWTYSLEGAYGDIGAVMLKDEEGFWTLFPFPHSPAEKAGVLKGDRLLGVNDIAVTQNTPLDHIKAAIFGPAGESVLIEISRPPDFASVRLNIIRGEYPIPSVQYRIDPAEPRLGILTLNLIGAQTADEVIQAIQALQSEGVTHFVLDLRHNPGGYLFSGVEIARLFLEKGEIFAQHYRNRETERQRVETPGPLTDIPLAILIGEGTASAAELVAGALQVNDRAILVGNNSYGKDTIQQVFVLSDESSLRLTAAHWWVPGLESNFAEQGLIPDLPAPEFSDPNQPDPAIQTVRDYFFP